MRLSSHSFILGSLSDVAVLCEESRPSLERRNREVMVFSRKPVVFLTVLVVVMALGIIGVLQAVSSASPDNDVHHNAKAHSTLTVVINPGESKVVDLGAQGPSQGDMRVVNAPLYNEGATRKLGRFDQFAVLTDPADEPNEKAHVMEVSSTYTLPGGEISVQGVTPFTELSGRPPKDVNAVSGGTEKYAGVRGEVHVETHGKKVIATFHFIR
jgi:hypothetical protein